MWLILAIAILIVLFVSKGSEKARDKAYQYNYDKQTKKFEERKQQWLARVTDGSLEKDLEYRLYKNDEKLIKEIADTWNDYFPDRSFNGCVTPIIDPRKYIVMPLKGTSYIAGNTAIRMLMANRGKLLRTDASWVPITIVYISQNKPQIVAEQEVEEEKDFIRKINLKLKDHGIDEALYIKTPGGTIYRFDEGHYHGQVMWGPMINEIEFKTSEMWKQNGF